MVDGSALGHVTEITTWGTTGLHFQCSYRLKWLLYNVDPDLNWPLFERGCKMLRTKLGACLDQFTFASKWWLHPIPKMCPEGCDLAVERPLAEPRATRKSGSLWSSTIWARTKHPEKRSKDVEWSIDEKQEAQDIVSCFFAVLYLFSGFWTALLHKLILQFRTDGVMRWNLKHVRSLVEYSESPAKDMRNMRAPQTIANYIGLLPFLVTSPSESPWTQCEWMFRRRQQNFSRCLQKICWTSPRLPRQQLLRWSTCCFLSVIIGCISSFEMFCDLMVCGNQFVVCYTDWCDAML